MSSDQLNSAGSPPSSESLLRRLRIDEIKERRRRFYKETAERWIQEQQFGGDSSSSTSSASTASSSIATVHRIDKSFSPPLLNSSNNVSLDDSENSNRTLQSEEASINSDVLDSVPGNKQITAAAMRRNSNDDSSSNTCSPTNSSKPLSDRNSFLNAFEFFSKGATVGSPPEQLSPGNGENVPIPKPRSIRGNLISSPTRENFPNQFQVGKSPPKVSWVEQENDTSCESSENVRSTVLKFQDNVQSRPNTSPTGTDSFPFGRRGSDGASKSVKLMKTSMKLELKNGDKDSSTSYFDRDELRKSSAPPFLEGNVSKRVGMFAKRQGQGDEEDLERNSFDEEGPVALRRKQSGQRASAVTSPSSSSTTPFATAHSPPPAPSVKLRQKFLVDRDEEEDESLTSSSSSADYNKAGSLFSRSVDEVETPSSSSTSTAQQTPADTLPPPPPLSEPPVPDHIRKRPSIPDILVVDPIVVVTDDRSSGSPPPPPNPVSRRRPSSILKKRDSTAEESSAPNSTTVSFACVDPKDDDEDEDYGLKPHREGYLFSGSGSASSEPYRRRSRSYSGSSSASASGAGGSNTRRRNSAEAPYYSSTEEFPNGSTSPGSKGILKHSCSSLSVDGGTSSSGGAHSDSEFKSILKQPALRRSSLGSNIHTVHQTRFSDDYDFDDHSRSTSPHSHGGNGHRSILKRKSSTSSSQPDVSTASSLRSTASSYCSSRESLHEPSSDPKPILKKKSSSEEISDSDYNSTSCTPPPPRPILKNKRSGTTSGSLDIDSNYSSESIPILVSSADPHHPIKPCLKKPCKSFDESALWSSASHNSNNGNSLESTSSIMRKSSPHICSVKKCEEDSNKSEEEEEESEPDFGKHPKNSVLFARRESEPVTSPTEMDESVLATRRGSGETFSFKRKIELGKIDFSGVYESGSKLSPPPTMSTSPSSSTDTSPSSGISSPTSTPTTSSNSPKKMSGSAITQKIAALQSSGESSWKKRVSKLNPEVEITDGINCGESETPKAAEKRAQNGILANRLSMLESSQESWRKRIGEKDAKEFTVQGKLERAGKKVIESVLVCDEKESSSAMTTTPTKKKSSSSPFKNVFRGMRGSKTDESIGGRTSSSGGSSGQCVMIAVKPDDGGSSTSKSSIFQRSKSMRYGRVSVQSPTPSSQNGENTSPTNEPPSSHHVVIPVMRNDNETFTRFFDSSSGSSSTNKNRLDNNGVFSVVVEDDSFNSIIKAEDSRQLLGSKRQVKAARKKERGVKNPIKALAGRLGSQEQSYVDLNPEIRESENIRARIRMENSKSAAHAHLSIEALAGLASKEDFTSVKLRRAQQEISAQYPYPILIRIKGKRFVQTRLAAPEVSSLNSGDNFILITQTKLYHFIGEYSNRMERSKSLDIVAHVIQKKEFGCNLHTKVITLQEEHKGGAAWDSFFEVLGCVGKSPKKIKDDPDLLGDEADEAYEGKVISRNKVWKVITGDELDEKLVPLREFWGTVPKHCLLESTEVLIFDFGGEMYVWSGSKAPLEKKRLGYRLAQHVFEMEGLGKEFDDVKGTVAGSKGGKKDELRRPSWCWLRKQNQHMENILFIEKFFDWPEEIGRIRVGKNAPKKADNITLNNIFVPCDGATLAKSCHEEVPDVSLILEGFDVKRGRTSSDKEEKRNYSISTTKLQTWAISEFSKTELDEAQIGHFSSSGTYVIRWQYTISFVGKDLKGNQSRHNASTLGGRDRCAYFFWHGKRSKITEQGASALMTVELDDLEERNGGGSASSRGPQVRVEQNYEPPAFLSLFNGKMFIHDNQVNNECEMGTRSRSNGRLYVTLGQEEEEGHFLEVACCLSSLRSNGSFLLFDVDHRVVFVWIGNSCSAESKKLALAGANYAVKNENWSPYPTKVVTVKQSHETDSFWSCLLGSGGSKKDLSRKSWLASCQTSVEMFRFTSINGKFEAIPVISPRRILGSIEPFPIIQEDLYGANVSQPSMFLILSPDNILYLWQGWRRIIKREYIPEEEAGDITQQAVDSIPLTTIWPKYRRCSVETSLNYAQLRRIKNCYLIYAGIEPVEFIQLFPYWDPHISSVKEAHDYHIAEGKRNGEQVDLVKVLEELTVKRTFTVEELMEKPEGVDLSRLEDYMSDEDFQRLFSMPRSQFSSLQGWRKTELKKAVGLF